MVILKADTEKNNKKKVGINFKKAIKKQRE